MADTMNVSSAKPVGGGVYVAPVGTTLPTDFSTTLNSAFKDAGYCDENGFTESTAISSVNKKAWNGTVVDVIQTDKEKTYKAVFMESKNADLLKLVYGDSNVTETASMISVDEGAEDLGAHAFVVEMLTKQNKKRRQVIPNAKVTAIGDIKYVGNDDIMYDLTITAMVDSTGKFQHIYLEK